jgi:hypothetical protein
MRRLSSMLLVVVLVLAGEVVGAPGCSAQARGTVEFTPVGDFYFPTQALQPLGSYCYLGFGTVLDPCPQPPPATHLALAAGGRVTAWLTRRVAVEGSLEYSPSTRSDNLIAGNMRVLIGLTRAGTTWWYLTGGPAFVSHTVTSSFGGVVGGGAHLRLGARLAMRAEFEEYRTVSAPPYSIRDYPQWDFFSSLGLSFALKDTDRKRGEARAAPEP